MHAVKSQGEQAARLLSWVFPDAESIQVHRRESSAHYQVSFLLSEKTLAMGDLLQRPAQIQRDRERLIQDFQS